MKIEISLEMLIIFDMYLIFYIFRKHNCLLSHNKFKQLDIERYKSCTFNVLNHKLQANRLL